MPKLPRFKHSLLLTRALTHRSYFNEHPEEVEDNERLEFLGDAVLGFLIGELLYLRYPKMSEGKLTGLRARLVSEKQLATLANYLHIGDQMRLGKGTILEGGRQNSSLLSDTFEAIIGAYFLDSGIDKVREFVEALFMPIADSIVFAQSDINFKSRFQEWALANIGKNPEYSIIAESGPDHAKIFTARVRVGGKVYGEGMGRSKQAAEKNAAEDALKKVELR
ncbi:MAG: ribonuclease III [Coleofasciculus sp. S288]|nr:ribonuclease III [Coleofasciculus sp. S288]